MKQEWNDIKAENPKTPEICPALLSVLENFSTEEYLVKNTSVKNTSQQ